MKISGLPLEALLSKLKLNFNDNLAAVATPVYNVKPFVLAWPTTPYSGNTPTVIFGQFTADNIEPTGVTGIDRLVIYVPSTDNLNFEKPRDFSGNVMVVCDFHIGWKTSDTKQPFESMTLAIEDALCESIQLMTQQNWGPGVVYNGKFKYIRSTIAKPQEGQGSLRQVASFRLDFMVNV